MFGFIFDSLELYELLKNSLNLYDFDLIVIGGEAEWATFAHACAKMGKSVLVLERGDRPISVVDLGPGRGIHGAALVVGDGEQLRDLVTENRRRSD